MPVVLPFRGLRFAQSNIDNLVSPPYDVISLEYQQELIERNKNNIVNAVLPKGEDDSKYNQAKVFLDTLLAKRELIFEEECVYYTYKCDYEIENTKKTLFGFLGALKLQALGGKIKPHEKTLKGPKIDRFKLITKTHAMFCPIMMIYDNKELSDFLKNSVSEMIYEVNFENQLHKIYKVTQDEALSYIKKTFKNQTCVIADGHHRYETALMIKEHFESLQLNNNGYNYALVLFVDKNDALLLSAIHRIIKKIDLYDFKSKLSSYFINGNAKDYDFIMYDGKYNYLKLKIERPKDLIEGLDVKIFEDVVYKKILNLSDEDIANNEISGYAHSQKEVVRSVDTKEAVVGFILKPITYEKLFEITNQSLTVPQKSTYFYPKIPSGFIGYHFNSIKGCKDV